MVGELVHVVAVRSPHGAHAHAAHRLVGRGPVGVAQGRDAALHGFLVVWIQGGALVQDVRHREGGGVGVACEVGAGTQGHLPGTAARGRGEAGGLDVGRLVRSVDGGINQ